MSKTTSRVNVTWVHDYLFLGDDGSGHGITFDSSRNDTGKGMSPMDALLTSVGACSGMDVVAILGKRRQKLTALRIEMSGERPEFGYPKPFTSISLKYVLTGHSLDEGTVGEAVRESMEKYCSAAATVNGRAKIEYSYEIVEG